MTTSFCSLITNTQQLIPPAAFYTPIRFGGESVDPDDWHPSNDMFARDSALIIPKRTAVALVCAMVFWGPPPDPEGAPTQYLHRITRDPFNAPDSTCTNDRAPTPGSQFHTFSWSMTVREGQPLAIMVAHNGALPMVVTFAEFKVWVPN